MSADAPWFRLVAQLTADDALLEVLAAALFGLGAVAVETQDDSTLPDPALGPLTPGDARLITYLEGSPEDAQRVRAGLETAAHGLGLAPEVSLVPFDDTSWREGWKRYFTPAQVTPRLAIRPPWAAWEGDASLTVLVIEPGMAFGTGLHETTRLCLRAIDRRCAEGPLSALLDVGCGSGVLSIAAARLGAARCVGVDIDAAAIEASEENAAANDCEANTHFSPRRLEALGEAFPFVVANMLLHRLEPLRDALIAATAAGGRLLLSGVLVEERAAAEALFVGPELALEEITEDGLWCALELRRRSS